MKKVIFLLSVFCLCGIVFAAEPNKPDDPNKPIDANNLSYLKARCQQLEKIIEEKDGLIASLQEELEQLKESNSKSQSSSKKDISLDNSKITRCFRLPLIIGEKYRWPKITIFI